MIRKLLLAIAAAFIAAAGSGAAIAGEAALTTDQASRFVDTLAKLDALGKEFEAEGKMDDLQIDSQPKAGEPFQPYSKAVAALKKKSPADLQRLNAIVKPHGFTPEQWGAVGDRVMVAWMALKMQEEDPRSIAMMEGMDASMLDMMPPEMRAQMESVFAMMETVKNAPDADKAAVAPVRDKLETYMDESAES